MEDKLIKQAFKKMQKSRSHGGKCPDECDFCQFLEGLMEEEKRALMEKHLLSCPACSDYVVSLHKVMNFPEGEKMPEIPAAEIEKACNLVEVKKKSVREKPGMLQAIREFFSFNWITQPIPVMVKSCAAALAVVLVLTTAYLYQQQNTPLGIRLEVVGRGSEVTTRGTAPELSGEVIKEGGVLYSKDYCRVNFELSRDAFAYVFYYDSSGELHQLYPDPAIVTPKKVKRGKTHSLPEEDAWFQLDDHSGTETVFMVASAKPISNLGELYQAAQGLNRDEAIRTFRDAAPVFKILNFIHQ